MADDAVRTYCRLCPAYCGLVVTRRGRPRRPHRRRPRAPGLAGLLLSQGACARPAHHHPDRLDTPLIRRAACSQRVGLGRDARRPRRARRRRSSRQGEPDAVGLYFGTHATVRREPLLRRRGAAEGARVALEVHVGDDRRAVVPVVRRLMGGVGWLFHSIDFERTTMTLLLGTNPVDLAHLAHERVPEPDRAAARARRGAASCGSSTRGAPRVGGARDAAPGSPARLGSRAPRLPPARAAARRAPTPTTSPRTRADVDELAAAVERFDLAEAVRLTGLAPDDLTDLLASVRRHGRLAVQTGTGTSMAPTANLTQWFATALLVVTGSVERRGRRLVQPGLRPGPRPAVACGSTGRAEPGPRSRPGAAALGRRVPRDRR